MYILTIYKLGDMSGRARLVFEQEQPLKIVQNNLICRGYAARMSQEDDMPVRDIAEVARALEFLNVGVPPLSSVVINQLISEINEHGN